MGSWGTDSSSGGGLTGSRLGTVVGRRVELGTMAGRGSRARHRNGLSSRWDTRTPPLNVLPVSGCGAVPWTAFGT